MRTDRPRIRIKNRWFSSYNIMFNVTSNKSSLSYVPIVFRAMLPFVSIGVIKMPKIEWDRSDKVGRMKEIF